MEHEVVSTPVKGLEEGYPLDVVPVKVGEEKGSLDGPLAKFVLQALAQPPHPTPAIQDDQGVVSQTGFNAKGVAAVAGISRLRSDCGASHAPKSPA